MIDKFPRFLMVGGVATACQYIVLVVLVENTSIDAVLSSSIGFVIGAIVSYRLNYVFTFRSDLPHTAAFPRFAVTAVTGLAINAAVMWLMASLLGVYYLVSQLVATGVAFCWNFVINSLWSFKQSDV